MVTYAVANRVFKYSHTIGRTENSGPGFSLPVALARGKGDLIYVVNRSYEARLEGKRVTICTVGEDYVGEFGSGGTGDGQLIWPTSIAFDKDENVYVADEHLQRISIFSKDGEFLGKWGSEGVGDGQFNHPSGLAFDGENNLFLVDSYNNRIQKFTKEGKFLAKWGQAGSGDGEFNIPWDIEIDRYGNVYISDWRNDRIQKFTLDGQFLMKMGVPGSGDGELRRPAGIAVDGDGDIYVADWGNDRMQVFAPDGSFVAEFTGEGTLSKWGREKLDANSEMHHEREVAHRLEREKLFWGPMGIDVDEDNRIFIVEVCRNRIQIYQKESLTVPD